MEKKRKKVNDKKKDLDLIERLDEISDMKKNENSALRKIYDALQKNRK